MLEQQYEGDSASGGAGGCKIAVCFAHCIVGTEGDGSNVKRFTVLCAQAAEMLK